MDEAHGGGRLVDVLPARAGRAVDLHLDVFRPDVNLGLLHLGQDGDRRRRRMDAAAGLGLRHALDAVDAGLEFQARIGSLARNFKVGFLDAAELRLVIVEQTDLPAAALGIHRIHAVEAVGKEGRFLTADAAADLHNDALVVVRVAREQQNFQFLLQPLAVLLGGGKFLLAEGLELRVAGVHQFARVGHGLRGGLIFPVGLDDGLELLLLFEQLARSLGIGIEVGLRGPFFHFHVAFFDKANVEAKKMIAALIVDLIEDGDHLMIDHSSTCYFSMKKLREKKNLTVITNSVELASEICTIEGWNVYMTGGQLRPESMALSGPASFEILHTYHVDKTLFSCKGIDMAAGITDSNDLHAEIKHAMVCAAKQPILAVDSSKFDKISFVNIARLQEVRVVVTNTKPSEEWLRTLARMEIRCIYPERT